jgi:signal peptidase I
VAALVALFIRTFVVQAFKIPSGSMIPSLLVGDYILVNKFVYGVKLPLMERALLGERKPSKGDVIVFKYPHDTSKDYIKRVVGVPGDKIQIINKQLLINDRVDDDPYAFHSELGISSESILDNFGPVTVPPEHLFVMGDNRDASSDSRVWGFVPLSHVKGKAFLIYWSWNPGEVGMRWDRVGSLLH